MDSVGTTIDPVKWSIVPDSAGRLWGLPTASLEALRRAGIKTLTVQIDLSIPGQAESSSDVPWLAVFQALAMVRAALNELRDPALPPVSVEAARMRLRRAIDAGLIRHRDSGRHRTIDPATLHEWLATVRRSGLDE